jgi:hypothetical protein
MQKISGTFIGSESGSQVFGFYGGLQKEVIKEIFLKMAGEISLLNGMSLDEIGDTGRVLNVDVKGMPPFQGGNPDPNVIPDQQGSYTQNG